MRTGITIAIDGFSSCGKTTLATDLATALTYVHIDTGAMYRAVTLYLIEAGILPDDDAAINEVLDDIHITFTHNDEAQRTFLNGRDITRRIREADVNRWVSPVAAVSAVRHFLVRRQRILGAHGGIVMDGRDIGTVVFPSAELKIFLTADKDVRVERRLQELLGQGYQVTRKEVEESLAFRDHIDTTREDSPLRCADDAVVIDNTHLTRSSQFEKALGLAQDVLRSL